MTTINLTPNQSYSIGFILGDGHLRKDQNTLRISIQKRDAPILHSIKDSILELVEDCKYSFASGTQNGFTPDFEFESVTFSSKRLTEFLVSIGVPRGKKAKIITHPNCEFDEYAFIRGYTDADGSLGLTGDGIPFISWVVSSEALKEYLLSFIRKEIGFEKKTTRNKRFGVYNIALVRTKAQDIIPKLYLNGGIVLERKLQRAIEAMSWEWKPRKAPLNAWTEEENHIIKTSSVEEAMLLLKRSKPSICNQRYNLKNGRKNANS